jgi:Fe-S cluster assembly protein SufD
MAMDTIKRTYLEELLRGQGTVPASPLSWLNQVRASALERANALTVPTTRDEEWRFTDLSPLYKTLLQPTLQPADVDAAAIEPFVIPEAGSRLVFVDGIFVEALSILRSEDGITVASLASSLAQHSERMQAQLGQMVDFSDDAFSAMNTARLRDGALVLLGKDREVSHPIHLLFVGASAGAVSFPRTLVAASAGSRCTVIEDFVSLHADSGFTNGVTEIAVGENANVRHIRLQRESANAFHIATSAAKVARSGRYSSVSISLGARLSRLNLNVMQAGEGTEFEIDGLALIAGRQLADTHSFVDHAFPNGRSRQLHKCIAGGASHAVFNGKILVRPGAQRTDSSQQNRSLLLTQRAHIDTKPQLEIFADDVKCAHGATVGQLDPEQVFYLKARGLSEATARNLLTFAFATEIVGRIRVPSLVQRLEDLVVRQTQSKES